MTPALRRDEAGARAAFDAALEAHRQDQLGIAESGYLRAIKLDPKFDEAHHLAGVVAFQRGQAAKAIRHFRACLALRPRHAQALNNLALALKQTGRVDEARAAFAEALAVRPEYVEAALNLGLLEAARGDDAAAERAWRLALAWRADDPAIRTNLGNLLRKRGDFDAALDHLRAADSALASALSATNLALVLIDRGRFAEAAEAARTALVRDRADESAWRALAQGLRLGGDVDAAADALVALLALSPDDAAARLDLGLVESARGNGAAAREAFARANTGANASPLICWPAWLTLPALNGDVDDIADDLARFDRGLEQAQLDVARQGNAEELLAAAASVSALALAYRPGDASGRLARFGDLVAAAVARAEPALAEALETRPRRASARIRVGFVGAYFVRHTVSRYFNALIAALDPERFEVHCWSTADAEDEVSGALASRVSRYTIARGSFAERAGVIRDAALDVLLYTDIALDPRQQVLASLRLAPVQGALYGHPATSGLPGLDVFFSGAALESGNAAAQYRERLICLPGLGAAPAPPAVAPDRGWFDAWRDARPTLVCAQSLSKMTPRFERALGRVIAATDARLCVFDRGKTLGANWLAGVRQRLAGTGIDVERSIAVLPVRGYARFLGALAAADLVVDTPVFSGGATSLDALALGVPVVTCNGDTARARQTAAMLRLLDADALIASDDDAFVATTARLIADRQAHRVLAELIAARAPILFDARAVHAAFALELETLARG